MQGTIEEAFECDYNCKRGINTTRWWLDWIATIGEMRNDVTLKERQREEEGLEIMSCKLLSWGLRLSCVVSLNHPKHTTATIMCSVYQVSL